jgi:acylphosphatase
MNQNNQKPVEELHAVIVGRVQNVGFRFFVVEKAQRLGLQGYTRNQEDGSVEVVAQGSRSALEHLLLLLWQGPTAAHVQTIHTAWQASTTLIDGFHIRH